jgi:hypothetical protein
MNEPMKHPMNEPTVHLHVPSRPHCLYVGGVKGGTGKSMTCATAIDYLRKKGPLMVIETDTGNPDIYLAHEKDAQNDPGFFIERANLDEEAGWHRFLNCLSAAKEKNVSVVINSRGANQASLSQFSALLQEAIELLDMDFKAMWAINNETFSIGLLEAYLQLMPGVPVYVVKNKMAGRTFGEWEASDARRQLEKRGLPSLTLEVLSETPRLALLNKFRSVQRAMEETDFATRLQISRWNRAFHTQLETLF